MDRRSDDEARRVLDALRRIVRALRLSSLGGEAKTGLGAAKLFVLQRLAEQASGSLTDLARRTLTDPSSVSVVVRGLVERGFVARRASPDDARRVELSLTAAGRAALRRAPPPAQAKLVGALGRLPPSELRSLRRGLETVVSTMGADLDPAPMFFEDRGAPKGRKSPRSRKRR